MSDKKKWSEIVLEERDKGNVVFLCIDEVMTAPVKDIIKQPVDGLLWDLNRDQATALTLMDKPDMIHWVNNFAVALVIRELKEQLTHADALAEAAEEAIDCASAWIEDELSGTSHYEENRNQVKEWRKALAAYQDGG